jgi:hypothetical protein
MRNFDCPATGEKCVEQACARPQTGICAHQARDAMDQRRYEAEKAEAARQGRIRRGTFSLEDLGL